MDLDPDPEENEEAEVISLAPPPPCSELVLWWIRGAENVALGLLGDPGQ